MILWVDGSTTRVSYVLCDCQGATLRENIVGLSSRVTGNEGEYLAAIIALSREAPVGYRVRLFSDSKLFVYQMLGDYRVRKQNMKVLQATLSSVIKALRLSVTFEWTPRENSRAGWLLE